MANSADPDQLASLEPSYLNLHCLQSQGMSGFSRARVNLLRIFISIRSRSAAKLGHGY